MFEPRIAPIDSIKWDGEGHVEIVHDGWTFAGAKRKDFFDPDGDWESVLVPGVRLRFWTLQFSRVIGIEYWDGVRWKSVWCVGNDWQPKVERARSFKAYADFIDSEGHVIAKAIDEGKTLEEIDATIAQGHSGNTYGWALHLGIQRATNRENAERVRAAHNAKYGQPEATGTINPAVLTIRER